eukprot:951702-Pelagomonas_calceolata.AAC.1
MEIGLDTYQATNLALELHAHSVQHAYKFASTRHALEKTPLNSHRQDQARGTAGDKERKKDYACQVWPRALRK